MSKKDLKIPEGWKVTSRGKVGADTGKQSKNLDGLKPGPQTGEDDYHSKHVDPEGPFGAAKVEGGEEHAYQQKDPYEFQMPEGHRPLTPHDQGLQAPLYPKRHSGVASSY